MKKITYHPLMKLLTVLLFIASVEGALLFAYETAVSLAGSYRDSLTVYFFRWRFYFPVLLIFTIALVTAALTLLVLLCMGAGRSHRDEGVRLSAFYKIPLDLYLAATFFCCAALGAMTGDLIYGYALDESTVFAYWAIFLIPAFSLILALTLMSICARFRAGTWWRNNVITYVLRLAWRILRRCWKVFKRICGVLGRGLRRAGRGIWRFVSEIPSVPLAILFIISVFFLVLISVFSESGLLVVVTGVYAVGGILLGAIFSRRLERGAQKLAQGDLETRLDVSNLFGTYRRHAEHLNHIREGMSNAVEAQLRSERMKTELITNVSHDIKTPLTSIINYVDLMKKEQIESEKIREYLEVMDRQSIRLKKLIEDLMEVSKASTGNIALEMADTDFDVMLEQILGEYRERLTKAELNLCVDNAAKGAHIMADGKLLWRVFDNLLGNICKYSMPGTRVYLNVARNDEMLEISMRNISLYSLNITSEELMERFVRGDRSRHTEGSGLGLSIAKNLVELQKGNLEIVVDGDLFKAIVRFPLL
jgi:signal transduction histidine kinase